jgi:hypothetical protein
LYYDAYFKKNKKFETSNTAVQKTKNYSGYRYFGAKGLSQEFLRIERHFKQPILDNVIENFTDFPDVNLEAKRELMRLKRKSLKQIHRL